MDITINIDSDKFKDVIQNELNAFSKDEIHDIIRQCIVKTVNESDIISSKETTYSGTQWKYGTALQNALNSIDYSELAERIKDKVIKDIEENHSKIVEQMVWRGIIDNICNDSSFNMAIRSSIEHVIFEHENRTY